MYESPQEKINKIKFIVSSHERRLFALENTSESLHELSKSIALLTQRLDYYNQTLKKQIERVDAMEKASTRGWVLLKELIFKNAITIIIMLIGAGFLWYTNRAVIEAISDQLSNIPKG